MTEPQKTGFRIVWKLLHREGRCDPVNSDQFHRMRGQWEWAGCPAPISPWLLARLAAPCVRCRESGIEKLKGG